MPSPWILLAFLSAAQTPPAVPVPGGAFEPPAAATPADSPAIFEHSREAGPDETFFLVGDRLTPELTAWGPSADRPAGQLWKPRVQLLTGGYLAATMPEQAPDGVYVLRVHNDAGLSAPFVLNAPEPWWCGPNHARPGDPVAVYGRNLARRPDFARGFLYLRKSGQPTGTWLAALDLGKFRLGCVLPPSTAPGDYEVWIHAGSGGPFGWGGPVPLKVLEPKQAPKNDLTLPPGRPLQPALDDLARRGGGTLRLDAGTYLAPSTVVLPANVTLSGKDPALTTIQITRDPTARFPRLNGDGWDQAPAAVHTPGDTITYLADIPQAGTWTVWLRYATDMAPWNQPGVSGNHSLAADQGAPVPLMNLENTGSFGTFRWSRAATIELTAGHRTLTWKNEKGGGITLDALVLAADPAYTPTSPPFPKTGPGLVVIQGEDCARFVTKEGFLPGGDRAVAWLQGDHSAIENLTLLGDERTNFGVAIRPADPLAWVEGARVRRVRIADIGGKQAENCGIHLRHASRVRVTECDIRARAPLFLSGIRDSVLSDNRLVSVTRFGGNAEAAILGRTDVVERCVIERNTIASPPGAGAGGPTARRLLWLSTGHGSVTHNYIAGNGVVPTAARDADRGAGQPRFGGVAGTDQNVGEMILFEGNHRTAYFGPIEAADSSSVTLPKTLPPTPDDRLGSVDRKQLARDAQGHETPFWPPSADDGTDEPPLGEYYVTILAGRGQGQTRRVVSRQDEQLLLDRPWTVPPAPGSTVAVATMFYRNLIVDNFTPDGMTGIQLWISCVENVVAGNTIARQRKPALFLYASSTTLASSMPRTWNRGIAPLFWNTAEGNRAEDCSAGALVTTGDDPRLPIDFPRCLGNVIRHNSFINNRTDGVILSARGPSTDVKDSSPSVAGTIVEFNVVRDARTAYHASAGSDATVLRRNHAYFWYPVNNDPSKPTAFQVDRPSATVAIEQNSIEGIHGNHDNASIDLRTPEGEKRLPD